jgi:CheY-like chemotaxis protein
LGGSIWVDSVQGKGSVFGFEITVEHGKDASDLAKIEKQELGQEAKFAGKAIILAEDVEINREIVLSLLEDSGLAIECAENGHVALEKYKAAPLKYGLILMDTHMPEMDGLEATRRIRDFEKGLASAGSYKTVPIVAMIANVFKDGVEKCLASGMTSHLGKPIDITELTKQLERFLL